MAIQQQRQLMFLFSSGSRQENNKIAPQKTQLVFSHVSLFIICAAHAVGGTSFQSALWLGWLMAGVSSSPAPKDRPSGIIESRRAVSQSVSQ
jgi:hypothetical protein